jgi:ribosomal protein L13E
MNDRHDHASTIGITVHSRRSTDQHHDTGQTVIDGRTRNTNINQSDHDSDVDSL